MLGRLPRCTVDMQSADAHSTARTRPIPSLKIPYAAAMLSPKSRPANGPSFRHDTPVLRHVQPTAVMRYRDEPWYNPSDVSFVVAGMSLQSNDCVCSVRNFVISGICGCAMTNPLPHATMTAGS